jgi:hypothetical protein
LILSVASVVQEWAIKMARAKAKRVDADMVVQVRAAWGLLQKFLHQQHLQQLLHKFY